MRIKVLQKSICGASACLIASAWFACSTFQKHPESSSHAVGKNEGWPSLVAAAPGWGIRKLWNKHLDGYVSDLNLSKQGNAVLVGTLPDFDHDGGARKNLLRYFDGNGRERWRRQLATPVKSQAISADGSLVVVSTHEDEVLAFNSRGKQLWSAHATCAPLILESRKEVICYHDDDAEPQVAFDVFDWAGKKTKSYPITNDILALKISKDESSLALALTQGTVQVLSANGEPRWNARVPGEIVDVDVASGNDPRVAVLFSGETDRLFRAAIFQNGKRIAQQEIDGRFGQIAFTPDADQVFAYGNGEWGQDLRLLETSGSSSLTSLKESWRHALENNAHYTPAIFVSKAGRSTDRTQAILGIEVISGTHRDSRIVGVDPKGAVLWSLDVSRALQADEGAYLYGQSWSPVSNRLAVSSDDRSFGLFQLIAN